MENVKFLFEKNLVEGLNIDCKDEFTFCEGCVQGKHHREAFPKEGASHANKLLGLIHTDVWGPAKTPTFGGAKYFVSFTDDFSWKSFMYISKSKGECLSRFKEFKTFAEK